MPELSDDDRGLLTPPQVWRFRLKFVQHLIKLFFYHEAHEGNEEEKMKNIFYNFNIFMIFMVSKDFP